MATKNAMSLEKLKQQVADYRLEKTKSYDRYATVLEAILKSACAMYAPLGIVQARPKTVASFAEKAVRKDDKYDDPVRQLTDLCGARVIVNTTDEMRAICAVIRREFKIDEANTDDAGSRLREDEFGYRSMHFIVQIGKSEILGIPTQQDVIKDRKAEIQIRTVAQHAWAAVTHDRLFKASFTVPSRLRRLAHRAAALLEDADEALSRFESEMQTFLGSYSAYLTPADLAREIEIAEFVLGVDHSVATALRLAQLLHLDGRVDDCIHTLNAATGAITELICAISEGGPDCACAIRCFAELLQCIDMNMARDAREQLAALKPGIPNGDLVKFALELPLELEVNPIQTKARLQDSALQKLLLSQLPAERRIYGTSESIDNVPSGWLRVPVLVELGAALIQRWRRTKSKPDRQRGRLSLETAIRIAPLPDTDDTLKSANSERKLLATAQAILAADADTPNEVASRLAESVRQDPDDPYILCSQLANNLAHTTQPAILDSARPAILKAVETCRAHVRAGIQLPRAWFTMGRLFLLLGQDSKSLDSYSKGIRFYLRDGAPEWRSDDVEAELEFLRQVGGITKIPPPNRWARQLLRTGYWLKTRPASALVDYVEGRISCTMFKPGRRVLIIAGGTKPEVQENVQKYQGLLHAALDRFDGVVISGGTTAGIPGLVGEVSAALCAENRKHYELIGYRPEFVRSASDLYDILVKSGEKEVLGLAEPLQMWLDLLCAGVDPSSVRLLGINGGRIARFEYALALAMGALVGLVESSGRSADEVLHDPDWSSHPQLLPLPNDPMTAQAFSRVGVSGVPAEELERMGRIAHDVYRKGRTPDYRKPNTLPWEVLPEWYRKSSRDQAAYAFEMLCGWGFDFRKVDSAPAPISMPERLIEPMAEQEHGRWNFERLESGWRRGKKKDDARKYNPYLVPWADLAPEIRQYDRDSVRAFPTILAAGGYELIEPSA